VAAETIKVTGCTEGSVTISGTITTLAQDTSQRDHFHSRLQDMLDKRKYLFVVKIIFYKGENVMKKWTKLYHWCWHL